MAPPWASAWQRFASRLGSWIALFAPLIEPNCFPPSAGGSSRSNRINAKPDPGKPVPASQRRPPRWLRSAAAQGPKAPSDAEIQGLAGGLASRQGRRCSDGKPPRPPAGRAGHGRPCPSLQAERRSHVARVNAKQVRLKWSSSLWSAAAHRRIEITPSSVTAIRQNLAGAVAERTPAIHGGATPTLPTCSAATAIPGGWPAGGSAADPSGAGRFLGSQARIARFSQPGPLSNVRMSSPSVFEDRGQ